MKHQTSALLCVLALSTVSCATSVTVVSAPYSAAAPAASAALKLADPFGDEMVLQQGMQVPVWGSADPGAVVTVAFAGQTQTATADARGRWKVALDAMPASADNRVMTVTRGDRKIEVKDVLVGEVWICSGQSNMEMGVPQATDAKAEIAAANFPAIRLRVVNKALAPLPLDTINGSPWRVCTPASITQGTWSGFSAAGYYFGRDLHRELKVPVGLIQSAWGGTLVEPWTTPEGFRSQPKLKAQSAWLDKVNADYREAFGRYLDTLPAWEKAARAALAEGAPLPPLPQAPGHPIGGNTQPTALYNAMIAPWTGFAVRGAVWYQGESNHIQHDGALYADRMAALVGGWRKAWGRSDADFPFYFVQIAPFSYSGHNQPEEMGDFWEAQEHAAGSIPNTGLAHTQDIGELHDIHPHNKQEVGHRLARLALSRTYGAKTQAGAPITDDCGPEFKSLEAKDGSLVVKFDHAKSGLTSRDAQPPTLFEIAGEDHVFAPAEAQISGDTVVLKNTQVPAPVEVRFAWSDLAEPNLVNGDKLPAATFHATTGTKAK